MTLRTRGIPGQLTIHFEQIQVTAIEEASGIFVGTNTQWNWSSFEKNNYGLGEISGECNRIVNNVNAVYDNDVIDAPLTQGDLLLGRG